MRGNTSDEKEALQLLENIHRSSLLKTLADSTTHVLDSYPRRHRPSLGTAHKAVCAYRDLFKTMFRDLNLMSTTQETKATLKKEQHTMREEWIITGTGLLPWPPLRLSNLG